MRKHLLTMKLLFSIYRSEPIRENSIPSAEFVSSRNQQNSAVRDKDMQNNKNSSQRTNSGRVVKPRNKEIKESDHRGFTTKTRQLRAVKNDQQKVLPPRKSQQQPKAEAQHMENKGDNTIQEIEKEMNKLSVNGVYKGSKYNSNNPQAQQPQQQRQASVPPRLQNEQKGSKRYSSMRQRSLPEANTPPAVTTYQHASYYPNGEYHFNSTLLKILI